MEEEVGTIDGRQLVSVMIHPRLLRKAIPGDRALNQEMPMLQEVGAVLVKLEVTQAIPGVLGREVLEGMDYP